jgi:hypothetical protein
MGSPRRTVVATMLVVTSLVGVSAMAATWKPHGALLPPGGGRKVARLTGHLNAMYPSRHAKLRVHVRNRSGQRIVVHRVHARVHRGSGLNGRCPGSMLVVRDWRGSRRVQPGKTQIFRLRVWMRKRAPDRCQGTRWRLSYDARTTHP